MTATEAPRAARLLASNPSPAISSLRIPVLRPLRIVSDTENKAPYYYTDDHVRALISDLRPSANPGSRRRAARKLRMLSKHSPENRLRIAAAGAVQALATTLQTLLKSSTTTADEDAAYASGADAELQEHTVTALYNLSLHDSNLPLVAACVSVPLAVGTLGCPGATPDTRSGASCLLLRLAHHGGGGPVLEEIGRSSAIPHLVDLLRTGELRGQKDAATALYALATQWEPNRSRAAQAGLVPVLLELMEDPGSCMVEKAAGVLSAVAANGEARAQVAESGGVAVLVDMIEMGTVVQREIAVKVLLRMCSAGDAGDEFRRIVVSEGAVPALLTVAHQDSECSAKSRHKAKVLLEILGHASDGGDE